MSEQFILPEDRVVCLVKNEEENEDKTNTVVYLACGKLIEATRLQESVVLVTKDPKHLYARDTIAHLERKEVKKGVHAWQGLASVYTTNNIYAVNCPMCIKSNHFALVELSETELSNG